MAHKKSREDIYFTIIPQKTGFTDQLNQFSALYRLGKHLGYTYYHTNFSSPRSTFTSYNFQPDLISIVHLLFQQLYRKLMSNIPGFRYRDIFDLLGINSYLNKNNPKIDKHILGKICINLNPNSCETGDLKSFYQIVRYVEAKINESTNTKKLVVFRVEKGRSLLTNIISSIPMHPCQYGLKEQYLKLRNENNWNSKYDNSQFRVLIHIRLGDTSLIKTPWDTYISSWSIYKQSFKETFNMEEAESPRHIKLEDYKKLLSTIVSRFDNSEICTLIFTDGYERAFQRIIRFRKNFNFSRKQASQLMNNKEKHKKDFYRLFDDINESKIIYGEGILNLLDMIHAIFDSDLIVVGTVQGMIINFVSNYLDSESMPVVAVLYRGEKPNYSYLNNQNLNDKFMFIDVESPDYGELLDFINLKIYGSHG